MKLKIFLVTLVASVVCAGVWAEDSKPWFDLENCAFCKNFKMGTDEYIVDHMKGNYHTLPNGFLAIMTIEDDFKDEYAKSAEGMQKVVEDMQKTGTQPQMCQHCATYGELMMGGAVAQEFNSDVAIAYMMTSDNPEMVKKLHAFAERNNAEMAKWNADRAAAKAKKAEK